MILLYSERAEGSHDACVDVDVIAVCLIIQDQDVCTVTLWNGSPIAVEAPNFVVLEIIETDPGLKGDTSGGGGKPATLETSAVVRVPLFIEVGEVLKIDTRTGEYVARARD